MCPQLDIEFPDELLLCKENIQATIKPFIEIKTQPGDDLQLWQSKFGGDPYFPLGLQYPKDARRKAMVLLAQINFSETPTLKSFPEKGVLQFYISGEDDLFGADLDNLANQANFRVFYFPDVIEDETQLVTDFDFVRRYDACPIDKQSALIFNVQQALIPTSDYQFKSKIFNLNPEDKRELYGMQAEFYEAYDKLFLSAGHKLGGYPYFTQSDPRYADQYQNGEYMLLFQMDTDNGAGIMWGDCGVANFFISEKDLANKDFSKVLYHWDCS